MSDNCENTKHPLLRDGTSQLQRQLDALLPSYVSVDERSMEDLIAFAKKYAEEIFFYNDSNVTNGNWVDFFSQAIDEAGMQTEPHYALFIAFLDLFRFAQDDLNTITQRHLDFYYREVLQLEEMSAVPDQVFAVFELAKNTTTALLEKDILLNAGKDATGVNLSYALDKDIVINKGVVSELKALFADKTNDYRIYASSVANSSDGTGGKLTGDELKWRTFGYPGLSGTDRPQGETGFAVSSPVLFLAEGNRAVSVTMTFNQPVTVSAASLTNAFRTLFSGEKEWIEPEQLSTKIPADTILVSGNQITINRTLTQAQPSVIAYDANTLGQLFDTSWPVMKVLFNTDAGSFAYAALKNLVLQNVTVSVSVLGVKNLVLYNDNAKLKADKPFEPFTSRPLIGSSFYIGSEEIFQKNLSSVQVDIDWHGLPSDQDGFSGYYANYLPASENTLRTNTGFKASVSVLDGKTWVPLGKQNLFDQSTLTVPHVQVIGNIPVVTGFVTKHPLKNFRRISINGSPLQTVPRDSNLGPVTAIDSGTFKGFLKLELSDADFGHKNYAVSLTQQVVNSLHTTSAPTIINQPYTPTIKEIALNYTSSVTIDFSAATQDDFDNRVDQFYHVQPFGVNENHPFLFIRPTPLSLFPQFNDEGSLYIGISGLNPSQVLTLLFKVAEGSANPDYEKQQVQWSYLSANQWVEFPDDKILSDGTDGLLTSGIVTYDIPSEASNDNTVLTPGLHWLKVSVTDFSGAVCDLIDIKAQAVTATFADNNNDPEHLRLPLPAETISKLRESNSLVPKVAQPYASFGGKVKEQSTDFYIRISERLRHKHRAVTIWDYEHIVLQEFPSVYKVKCISHTEDNPSRYTEIAPGHVTLIAVSNLRNKNLVNPLQPKTSLTMLEQIHDYVTLLTSWWVELDVRNPDFEELRVSFNVRFLSGYDNGFYGAKLNEDIKKFLSPWAYDPGKDISFGGVVHRSSILNFVEEQPYVDFVSCFRMDHIAGTQLFSDVESASPLTAASILVSASQHYVTVLETDDCECDDNIQGAKIKPADDVTCDIKSPPKPTRGIGSEAVGEEIIGYDPATTGINFFQIENDFTID